MTKYTSDGDRIARNVAIAPSGCWEWQQCRTRKGYGQVTVSRAGVWKRLYAHRVSYEVFVGPIPDGLQIDHLCRNRACVNPKHLEPVTSWQNNHRSPLSRASINAAKRKCPKGHAYDERNTYRNADGSRLCRTCRRALDAARRDRKSQRAAGIRAA
jgi:hypothetical protein